MTHIIDTEPSTYEEASRLQVWKDAMVEEHQSIMKNDVWEVVLRPEGKLVATSKWIYKIKHAVDGSIENTRLDSWLDDSLQLFGTPPFELSFLLLLCWVGGFTRWT